MPVGSTLMVPIHLDALLLQQDRAVVDAMADFSQLPFFDGTRYVNSGTAYLSEAILSNPFANQHLRLPAGIHLHWALPDALTVGRQGADGQEFPYVPNRWLVRRTINGSGEKAWVVESDYLHPDGQGTTTGSLAYPVARPPEHKPFRPYRYLGRVVPLESWKEHDLDAEYLGRLTAVGYGDPTFAAFYPNCRNVFGFHDGEYTVAPEGLRYDLVGWYSDSAQDFLKTIANAWRDRKMPAAESLPAALKQIARWDFELEAGVTAPEQMLCYARLTFAPSHEAILINTPISIAVGNSGAEALAAYLADAIDRDHKDDLEEQLEAMLLAPRLAQHRLDLDAAFREARHAAAFVSLPASTLWMFRAEAMEPAPANAERTAAQIDLPPELAAQVDQLNHAVNTLNQHQQAYDRAIDEIEALSQQLFADWYRYMLCAYPLDGTGENYPDVDEVKRYIETQVLVVLQDKVKAAGTLELRQDAADRIYPVATDVNPDSQAGKVGIAAAEVQARLAALNNNPRLKDSNLAYQLRHTDAPRLRRSRSALWCASTRLVGRSATGRSCATRMAMATRRSGSPASGSRMGGPGRHSTAKRWSTTSRWIRHLRRAALGRRAH